MLQKCSFPHPNCISIPSHWRMYKASISDSGTKQVLSASSGLSIHTLTIALLALKLLPCESLSSKGLLQDRDCVLPSSIDQDFSTIFDTKVFDQDRQSLRCPMSDGQAQEKREHPYWSRSKLHPGAQLHSPLQNWPVRGPPNSYNSLQDLKSQGPHSLAAPRALEKTQRSEESLELAGTRIESEALKRAEAGRGLLGGAPTASPVRTLM